MDPMSIFDEGFDEGSVDGEHSKGDSSKCKDCGVGVGEKHDEGCEYVICQRCLSPSCRCEEDIVPSRYASKHETIVSLMAREALSVQSILRNYSMRHFGDSPMSKNEVMNTIKRFLKGLRPLYAMVEDDTEVEDIIPFEEWCSAFIATTDLIVSVVYKAAEHYDTLEEFEDVVYGDLKEIEKGNMPDVPDFLSGTLEDLDDTLDEVEEDDKPDDNPEDPEDDDFIW